MIVITGLGPGDFDRNPGPVRDLLLDLSRQLILRTRKHPAAEQLALSRDDIVFCDDLYESCETFEELYSMIADRVIDASNVGPVVYAVPGGPAIGEFAVREIVARVADVEVVPAETFVDAILAEVSYDPFQRGLQILSGHDLVDPVVLDKPTIVGHLDRPEILADVASRLSRVLPESTDVTIFNGIGAADARTWNGPIETVDSSYAGFRTSMWIDAEPGGLVGAVRTMERLRRDCPWDREQTHASLTKNLIEESYELIDAISVLDDLDVDYVGYAGVEEEVGDVLLQVLFHAAIAKEAGFFDIDDAAEVLRQKLVRRHPHVFSDVEVADANEVKSNWDRIKREEKGQDSGSALDGIPRHMPALHLAAKMQNRASKAGFKWENSGQALDQVREEIEEVAAALESPEDFEAEIGDLLFSVVDLAARSGVDAEIALRRAVAKFDRRFRIMETSGDLKGLAVEELQQRWDQAKKT